MPDRLLIADDHDLVRDTIAAFIDTNSELEVATTSSLDGVMKSIRGGGPFELILLDYNMPGMDGLSSLSKVIEANKGQPVALLSGAASRSVAQEALKMGAAGFIPKTLKAGSIVAAAKFMIAGQVYAPFDFLFPQEEPSDTLLTRREKQVLGELCLGKANKEIARDLDLREATVKMHVRTLTRKLGARNRTHAALIARERSLF